MTQDIPEQQPLVGAKADLSPHYLFYCFKYPPNEGGGFARGQSGLALEPPYQSSLWRPGARPRLPSGMPNARLRLRFLFRWGIDRLHLFAAGGSGIFLIHNSGRLVHYSAFTPRYWRFPFIADGDFQIGDTWTDPAERGKGLASFAVARIIEMLAKPETQIWYVVEASNQPSIRVVEKAKFILTAEGTFVLRWRLKLPGAYLIRREIRS